MSSASFDEPITLAEAAEICGLARNTLKAQVQKQRLQAVKRGRDLWTTRAWLQQYLDSRQSPGQYHKLRRKESQ